MSRLLVTNKSFELLEPYEGKLSRTVLRGESSRKGADLLDKTNMTVKASKNGNVEFRGFKGKYHITYTDKFGKEQVIEYHLK